MRSIIIFKKHLALSLGLGATMFFLVLSGCVTPEQNERSMGARIDDTSTSSRVMAALADDPIYKFRDVKVETFRNTVQLSGFVLTEEQKNRAGNIASSVDNVDDVRNDIVVVGSADQRR